MSEQAIRATVLVSEALHHQFGGLMFKPNFFVRLFS